MMKKLLPADTWDFRLLGVPGILGDFPDNLGVCPVLDNLAVCFGVMGVEGAHILPALLGVVGAAMAATARCGAGWPIMEGPGRWGIMAGPVLLVEKMAGPVVLVEKVAGPVVLVEKVAGPVVLVEKVAGPVVLVEKVVDLAVLGEKATGPVLLEEKATGLVLEGNVSFLDIIGTALETLTTDGFFELLISSRKSRLFWKILSNSDMDFAGVFVFVAAAANLGTTLGFEAVIVAGLNAGLRICDLKIGMYFFGASEVELDDEFVCNCREVLVFLTCVMLALAGFVHDWVFGSFIFSSRSYVTCPVAATWPSCRTADGAELLPVAAASCRCTGSGRGGAGCRCTGVAMCLTVWFR